MNDEYKELDGRLRHIETDHATTKAIVNGLSENQKDIIATQKIMAQTELERVKSSAIHEERFNGLTTLVQVALEQEKQENDAKNKSWLSDLPAFLPHIILTGIFSTLITAVSTAYYLGINHPH